MQVLHVVGARPNFMKAAPVVRALGAHGVKQRLVHTGQHYDANMSDVFFDELDLPRPDIALDVGSGTHTAQTAEVMKRLEKCLDQNRPDWVLVYGDVNSTLAATLTAAKMQIPVAHVEAGLRSFDRTMPEELNRIVTDQLADLLLTPSVDADENLTREGIAADRIRRVGNVMIDTLRHLVDKASRLPRKVTQKRFALVTLHRPSNVDNPPQLDEILHTLDEISQRLPLIFPVHPRTLRRMQDIGFRWSAAADVQLRDPIGYLECLALQQHATVVITDSGGIQEETTYLGVPCLTLRKNTERPVTVDVGTNILVGSDMECLCEEVNHILNGRAKPGRVPELWDGRTGERIAEVLLGGTPMKTDSDYRLAETTQI